MWERVRVKVKDIMGGGDCMEEGKGKNKAGKESWKTDGRQGMEWTGRSS